MSHSQLDRLREHLDAIPSGPVEDTSVLVPLLQDCWRMLRGAGQEKTHGYKLSRMEQATWQPPILEFLIERHGRTVLGSTRAELQGWSVNLDTDEALLRGRVGRRHLRKTAPRVDVNPFVGAAAKTILTGQDARYVKWLDEERCRVRLVIREITPNEGYKQTVSSRRRRFAKRLEAVPNDQGWRKVHGISPHTYEQSPS